MAGNWKELLRQRAGLLLAAAFILASVSAEFIPSNHPTENHVGGGSPQAKKNEPALGTVQHVNQPASQQKRAAKKEGKSEQFVKWVEWFFGDPNRAIAFGTFLLAMGAFAQFELTRRTAKRQLRAYVFVETKFAKLVDGNIIVSGTIKNMGQTPAYDMRGHRRALVGTTPFTGIPPDAPRDGAFLRLIDRYGLETYFAGAALWLGTKDSLGPQDVRHFELEVKTTSEQIEAIMARKAAVWLIGRITYRDAFRKRRYTKYRYYLLGPQLTSHGRMIGAPTGNQAN